MNSTDYLMLQIIGALILLAIVLGGVDAWYRNRMKKQDQAGLDDKR